MTCVACQQGKCAGRIVCGDPPDCDSDSCTDDGGGGNQQYPPALNITMHCRNIYDEASYKVRLPRRGRVIVLAKEAEDVFVNGRQLSEDEDEAYGDEIVSYTVIDRLIWTEAVPSSFYALNEFVVTDLLGEARKASDGAIGDDALRYPDAATGVMTIGTEVV